MPNGAEVAAGLLLVFFLPGYAVTKATFPEWRIRGPDPLRRVVEVFSVSFVLSVVLTILAGYALLSIAPGGFSAYWSAPSLEILLVGITALGLAVAAVRGGFAREPPIARRVPGVPFSEEGAFELMVELDRIDRAARRLERKLRRDDLGADEAASMRSELDRLRTTGDRLRRDREASYAE